MKIKTAVVYNDRGTEFRKLLNLGFYPTAFIQLFDITRLIALSETAILLQCRIAIKYVLNAIERCLVLLK